MFCVTYSGRPFTIDWPNGGKKKTKLNKPFGSVCKWSRRFFFFFFLPELHHVPVACKAFVAAHKAAIVPAPPLKRRKRRQHYSKSGRRSQICPLPSCWQKEKWKELFRVWMPEKKLGLACDKKSIFHFWINMKTHRNVFILKVQLHRTVTLFSAVKTCLYGRLLVCSWFVATNGHVIPPRTSGWGNKPFYNTF